MADESTRTEQSTRLLRRLFKGLDNRKALLGGAARTRLDQHLLEVLAELGELHSEDPTVEGEGLPPRQIATALGLALFSQPHGAITYQDLVVAGTEELDLPRPLPCDQPLVVPPEVMEEALGLPAWELDDLREEVDNRVGRVLKQARAVHWLWQRFGLPEATAEPLFRVLFPGTPNRMGPVGMMRHGSQLYAVVEQDPPPHVAALYLPWLDHDEEHTYSPLGTFRGRYVDEGLRRALGRAIGAEGEEVEEILDHLVTIVPRTNLQDFLQLDLWRSSHRGHTADLSVDYTESAWLVRPLRVQDLDTSEWMAVRDGKLVVRKLRRTLDGLLLPRVALMARQLQALILARLLAWPQRELQADDLVLFDVSHHLARVARPLLDFTQSEPVAEALAQRLDVPVAAVTKVLGQVRKEWTAHLERVWLGPPQPGQPLSVQSLLAVHLVATHASLARLLARPALSDLAHRDVLLYFAAHYFASAPLQRLWATTREDGSPSVGQLMGPDPVGRWFWPTWMRLVAYFDVDPVTESEDMKTFSI